MQLKISIFIYSTYHSNITFNSDKKQAVRDCAWDTMFCEAGGGSPNDARLEQTPYPFQPH